MEKKKENQADVFGNIKMLLFFWMLVVSFVLLAQHSDSLLAAKEQNVKKTEEKQSKKEEEKEAVYSEVPHYYQHDKKWGNEMYAEGTIADSGCGPTCLSMVYVYYTGDKEKNPKWMAEYSMKKGYIEVGKTAWRLMSQGAEDLGLHVRQIPNTEKGMQEELEKGNVMICSMGPGIFTKEGHFIVFTKWKEGEFCVNDPNSRENSSKTWKYEEFGEQIKNIWVYSK